MQCQIAILSACRRYSYALFCSKCRSFRQPSQYIRLELCAFRGDSHCWHFRSGVTNVTVRLGISDSSAVVDPVEMLLLYPDGSGHTATLGTDILAGMRPQIVVPGGVWQGATMAPGFDYADYESDGARTLVGRYQDFRGMIEALSR